MNDWQPIDKAPKDESVILLWSDKDKVCADGFWLQEGYAGNGSWIWPYIYKTPTHWMPLPEFPRDL
jgi:Protein of unknown function (DUF551)